MPNSRPSLLLVSQLPRRRVRVHIRPASPSVFEHVTCRVCGFRGIPLSTEPGENFPTALVVTGTTYSWTNANDPLSVIDKAVTPVPNSASSCPFCGSTRFLDGQRGQGQ